VTWVHAMGWILLVSIIAVLLYAVTRPQDD
jgi:hypothetical protein